MHLTAVRCVLAIGFGLVAASPVLAQFGIARLSLANGAVTRQHRDAPAATTLNVSLMDGDQIETADGRAEITFHDGAVVHLDRHTRVIVNANERLQVLNGRIFLRTSGMKSFLTEAANGKMRVMPAGVVEVTTNAENRDVLLRVVSGWARMEAAWGSDQISAYHTAIVTGPAGKPIVTKFVPAPADEFERWTMSRNIMANSTEMPNGSVPFFGGFYYSSPAYVYYGGYPVYVTPYYVTPYYYSTPSYYSNYYSRPYSSYYGGSYYSGSYSYYGGSYSNYREPVYQWRTSTPAPTSVPHFTPTPPPVSGGASSGVRIPKG